MGHELLGEDYYIEYYRLDLMLKEISSDFDESDITEIILNGDWYVKD